MQITPHVRPVRAADVAAITAIYNHYIESSVATFEGQCLPEEELRTRIDGVLAAKLPWLVVESGGEVAGYAYATPWRARSAYRYSVEVTVYVDQQRRQNGHGERLYRALLAELKARGMKTAIGVVTLPNAGSQRLHEKLGFTQVGQLAKVGLKFDRWLDVGYWQCML